jgi:Prolyl oligopeptidase, N-terminal beta-propeller domain
MLRCISKHLCSTIKHSSPLPHRTTPLLLYYKSYSSGRMEFVYPDTKQIIQEDDFHGTKVFTKHPTSPQHITTTSSQHRHSVNPTSPQHITPTPTTPTTPTHTYTTHSFTQVKDPYRWLEDDVRTSKDVENWVDEQSNITTKYLDSMGHRKLLKEKITDIWNYEKFSNIWKV